MTIATCPECKDEVTVPAGVSLETQVKCPLCAVEFSMARLAKQIPPSLIVVSESQESGGRSAGGFPIQIRSGSQPVDAAPGGSFSFEEKSAPAGSKPSYGSEISKGESNATRSTARATSRPSGGKKQKNMVFEILKVVIGGAAAFPVVQLAVWWIGRSDPLDLGPKIGAVVPFVVPKHLRNPIAENDDSPDQSAAANKKSRDETDPMDNIKDKKATENVSFGSFDSADNKKFDKGLTKNPDFDDVATPSKRPKGNEKSNFEQDASNSSPKSTVTGDKGSTVEVVDEAITQLLNVPPIVQGQDNQETQDRHFSALCLLAEKLATLQGETAEVENAKSTAQSIISQDFPRPLQATSQRAKQLWEESPPDNTGIAVCGKLVKVEERDKYYQLEIKWAHQPSETIKIYSKDANVMGLAADADVVALATVVDGPRHQLPEGQFIVAELVVPLD